MPRPPSNESRHHVEEPNPTSFASPADRLAPSRRPSRPRRWRAAASITPPTIRSRRAIIISVIRSFWLRRRRRSTSIPSAAVSIRSRRPIFAPSPSAIARWARARSPFWRRRARGRGAAGSSTRFAEPWPRPDCAGMSASASTRPTMRRGPSPVRLIISRSEGRRADAVRPMAERFGVGRLDRGLEERILPEFRLRDPSRCSPPRSTIPAISRRRARATRPTSACGCARSATCARARIPGPNWKIQNTAIGQVGSGG